VGGGLRSRAATQGRPYSSLSVPARERPCPSVFCYKVPPVETAAAVLDVVLNGEPYRMPEGATVADLVASLGRHPRTVAVERNGELVPRARFGETPLGAGDRLEVVHFVQGG